MAKKSPNQETGLGIRGPLEALNQIDPKNIMKVDHAHLGPIWYLSEPSNVPYSPNQFLGWEFFCRFL